MLSGRVRVLNTKHRVQDTLQIKKKKHFINRNWGVGTYELCYTNISTVERGM